MKFSVKTILCICTYSRKNISNIEKIEKNISNIEIFEPETQIVCCVHNLEMRDGLPRDRWSINVKVIATKH